MYSHHHADHGGASSCSAKRRANRARGDPRLLLRDNDPRRPPPDEETFQDRHNIQIGGERIELAWHGSNHTPDNSLIHFPDHNTLMSSTS